MAKRKTKKNAPFAALYGMNGMRVGIFAVLAIAVIVGAYFAETFFSRADDAYFGESASGVEITEVMSANHGAWLGGSGGYYDWVELTNTSDRPVDITGWKLSDNRIMSGAFVFQAQVLMPGQCALVYAAATSANAYSPVNYAAFALNAGGESLYLYDKTGVLLQEMSVPEIAVNRSWALTADTRVWAETREYTPGLANTRENHDSLIHDVAPVNDGVIITEIMPANASYIPDEDGDFSDWIEICNMSAQPVNLRGYALTDDSHNRAKWHFPDITLAPGEYKIIYASGKSRAGAQLHTGFKLSSDGETLEMIDENGVVTDRVAYPALPVDGNFARVDGAWATDVWPTPGFENSRQNGRDYEYSMAAAVYADNDTGITLNECVPSTRKVNIDKKSYDWVEIYNSSGYTVDLSGFGLSNDPSKPRKWTFPEGATIASGKFVLVCLSGQDGYDSANRVYNSSIRLSLGADRVLLLTKPDGKVIDRMPVGMVISGEISVGRKQGASAFSFFSQTTPGSANTAASYTHMLKPVVFKTDGGDFPAGTTLSVEIECEPGASIYYTTDMTEPTQTSARYNGPITVSQTTVLRAAAFQNGALSSQNETRTYVIGPQHSLSLVSLVMEPDALLGETSGIYTNYTKEIRHEGAIEIYDADGKLLSAQPIEVSLAGHGTRSYSQKSFKIIARSVYGSNRLYGKLFENRDYTVFQSVMLRASGQDATRTRMLDSVLTSLLDGRDLMYQDTRVCVLYINGQYCGWYNLRERVTTYSIADWMGWDDPQNIQMFESELNVTVGKPLDAYNELMAWIKSHDMTRDENIEYVSRYVDIDNYFQYVAFNIYIANADLGNVRVYRNLQRDGKWRWIAFDTDLSFQADLDMMRRWLEEGGVGPVTQQDNTLFIGLMQNAAMRDKFLRLMGERLATDYTVQNVLGKFRARYDMVYTEIEPTLNRWNLNAGTYQEYINKLIEYTETRSGKLIGYIQTVFSLTDAQTRDYFGAALDEIARYERENK